MRITSIKLFIFILLSTLLISCQPSGDSEKSFGTKVPTNPDSSGNTTGGTNGNPSANLVSIVNGNNQTVAVGGTASIPLVVLVLQAPGQPVANETVYFQVVGGASKGTLNSGSVTTNSSGYAEVYFTGGSTIGDINVVASAPQGSVNFTITVTGASGYSINFAPVDSGQGQLGNINTALPKKFKVLLTDDHGSPVGGQNIRFMSVGTVQGNFAGGTFFDSMTNSSGLAESDFLTLSSTAGHHSINAYLIGDSSVTVVFGATSVTPVNSVIDPLKSKLTLSSGMVAANGMNTVDATLEIRDIYDNLIPNNSYSGLINVTGTPALMYGSSWLGSWTYSSAGTYKRKLLVGNTSGELDFSASVNSVAILSEMPHLRLTANSSVDNSKTTITSTISPLSADGNSTTTVVVQLRDNFGNPIDLAGQSIVVSTSLGTLVGTMAYHEATGTYRQLLIAPTSVGPGYFTLTLQTINGVAIPSISANIPLQAAALSAQNSSITITDRIFVGNNQQKQVTITLKDANNNGITAPATIVMSKSLQSGSVTGTWGNSGNVTSLGNGVYQINFNSPATTTTNCAAGVVCTEDLSAQVTVGTSNITLGPLRVQYKNTALTPSAAHSYLVMDNTSVAAVSGNVLTGRIYLRSSGLELIASGGNKSSITLEFTGCTPPDYSVVDNNSGNYTVILNSPVSGCSGAMTVKYGGTIIGTTSAPGSANASPVSYSFFGQISLGQSVLTLNPAIVSGGGSTTVSLEIKDGGGNNFPNCNIPTSYFQFQENHAATNVTGTVSCSVVAGKAFYTQTIERTSDFDEFYEVSVSAQYNSGSGWNTFSSMKTLQITPPNLAGFTIDCDNHHVYRDKYIYVNGGTLNLIGWEDGTVPTRNGCSPATPIRFRKIRVGSTGVVTVPSATTTKVYGVEFEATEEVTIEAGGKINLMGKGYVGAQAVQSLGYGPGNAPAARTSASHAGYGSSHQHIGTDNGSNTQPPYGDSANPNLPGSGAGTLNSASGAPGGGLVRIKTPLMKLDGVIDTDGPIHTLDCFGSSGGGIKIDLGGTGKLLGSGSLSAQGGARTGWNWVIGGGGRIAVLGDASDFTGGISVLSGSRTAVLPESSSNVIGQGNGSLYITKAPSNYTVPFSPMTLGSSNSYIGQANSFTIPAGYKLNLGSTLNLDEVIINGAINFLSGGKLNSINVTFTSSSSATHEALTMTNGNPKVDINASGIIKIHSGATLNAASKGYYASGHSGYGLGWAVNAYFVNAGECRQGGNHLTRGGGPHPSQTSTVNTSGIQWGDRYSPDSYGGAGSNANGRGGGIIRLVAHTIDLDGSIVVDGGGSAVAGAAGSAGGSIYLEAETINTGSSHLLSAQGSSTGAWGTFWAHSVGGGAGGLIGVKYHTLNGTLNTDITGGMNWSRDNLFVKYSEDGFVTLTPF